VSNNQYPAIEASNQKLAAPYPVQPQHDWRGVLRISAFRKLWIAMAASSLGDWLGLLAMAALAKSLSGDSYAAQSFAISGVFILRLLPGMVFGPIAGVIADRLDRRTTMVIADVTRFLLFLSVPLVGTLWWLYAATLLIEVAALFWIPAKDAAVPNLVPKQRLEAANQLTLVSTYGTAVVASGVFALLALVASVLGGIFDFFDADSADLALYLNAGTFLFSAGIIYQLTAISKVRKSEPHESTPTILATLLDGWKFVGRTKVIRGLILGVLGAFAAGGTVIGLARTHVEDLGAGNAAFGVLSGAVFLGLAAGMVLGPRILVDFSRRRLFGLAIVSTGALLSLLALIPNVVIVILLTLIVGAFAGIAWVTGYTMLGAEVSDELRGRTFAFVHSLVRVALLMVLAAAPLIAGVIGRHTFHPTSSVTVSYNGAAITMFLAGLGAAGVGALALRQMDDRRGVPMLRDLLAAVKGEKLPGVRYPRQSGYFIALEGADGAGKSTQAERIADWLRIHGHQVTLTREPGGTDVGDRLREILLNIPHLDLSARTEALLYAADRAQHTHAVIRPALTRGGVVICERYIDSSIAYQGAGRALPSDEIARVNRWAVDSLKPDLTVVLNLPPEKARQRLSGPGDRIEAEPADFHERVRASYLRLANRDPARYLVVDATLPPQTITGQITERLTGELLWPQDQRPEGVSEKVTESTTAEETAPGETSSAEDAYPSLPTSVPNAERPLSLADELLGGSPPKISMGKHAGKPELDDR